MNRRLTSTAGLVLLVLVSVCSTADGDEAQNQKEQLQFEPIHPPDSFVFEHPDDVQIMAILHGDFGAVLGNDFTFRLSINWDARSVFPAASEFAVTLPGLFDGPHLATVEILRPNGEFSGFKCDFRFFLKSDGGHDGEVGQLPDATPEWQASFISFLIQHPPDGYTFNPKHPKFVEVRVVDKEMELGLEDAVQLMNARATVYQRRPYSISVSVDGTPLGIFRRGKRVVLDDAVKAEGKHSLVVGLHDVHDSLVQSRSVDFVISSSAPSSTSDQRCDKTDDASCTSSSSSAAQKSARRRSSNAKAEDSCLPFCSEDDACGEHGKCDGAACVCDADWVGQACDHSLLLHTRYLPAIDPRVLEGRCLGARRFGSGAAALTEEVWRLQHAAGSAKGVCEKGVCEKGVCNGETAFRLRVPLQGLGIMLQFLVNGLSEGLRTARAMVVSDEDWAWLDVPGCARAGFHCYFQQIASCQYEDAGNLEEVGAKDLVKQHLRMAGLAVDAHGRPNSNVGIWVPDKYAEKGSFWYRSHLMFSLLQLLPHRRTELRDLQNELGFRSTGGGVIGLHVRRGDACAASVGYRTPCQPLERYMAEVRAMVDKYGATELFVASDDDEALAEIAGIEGLRVMSTPHDRSMLRSDWYVEDRIRHGLLDAAIAGESAVLDLFMLASCDYFVGTFSSHFGALAMELMAASRGYVPPYVSLDLAWAPRH